MSEPVTVNMLVAVGDFIIDEMAQSEVHADDTKRRVCFANQPAFGGIASLASPSHRAHATHHDIKHLFSS